MLDRFPLSGQMIDHSVSDMHRGGRYKRQLKPLRIARAGRFEQNRKL